MDQITLQPAPRDLNPIPGVALEYLEMFRRDTTVVEKWLTLSPPAANPRPQRQPLLPISWGVAMCLLAALGAAGHLSLLFAKVSHMYGEGWNAFWAMAAMQGRAALYSPAHEFITNNYPPLFFYLAGWLSGLTGDAVVAGRMLALAGVGASALLGSIIARRLGGSAAAATLAGLLILLYAIYPFVRFFAVNNPQWVAQTTLLMGILPLLRTAPRRRDYALSTAALVVTVLIKHNLIAWPLAILIWLYRRNARAGLAWMAWGFAVALGVSAALWLAYGPQIFIEVLDYPRTIDWSNARDGLLVIACLSPALALSWLGWKAHRDDPRWNLLAIYTVLATVIGVFQRLGAGVIDNAQFEGMVAAVILACASLDRSPDLIRQDRRKAILLIAPILMCVPYGAVQSVATVTQRSEIEARWAAMIADVRATRGPVLCEDLAVCFWAGKPMTLDFFSYGQKLRTGTSPVALARLVNSGHSPLVVLDLTQPRGDGRERLTDPIPSLIRQHYAVTRIIPGRLEERARQ